VWILVDIHVAVTTLRHVGRPERAASQQEKVGGMLALNKLQVCHVVVMETDLG